MIETVVSVIADGFLDGLRYAGIAFGLFFGLYTAFLSVKGLELILKQMKGMD